MPSKIGSLWFSWVGEAKKPSYRAYIQQVLARQNNDYSLPFWQCSFFGFALQFSCPYGVTFIYQNSAVRDSCLTFHFIRSNFSRVEQFGYHFDMNSLKYTISGRRVAACRAVQPAKVIALPFKLSWKACWAQLSVKGSSLLTYKANKFC